MLKIVPIFLGAYFGYAFSGITYTINPNDDLWKEFENYSDIPDDIISNATKCADPLATWYNGSEVSVNCSDYCGKFRNNFTCAVPLNYSLITALPSTTIAPLETPFLCNIGICCNGTCVIEEHNRTCGIPPSPTTPTSSATENC
ncbi:uncharacterized protein LOC144144861 [Haemaphysalis longicornis]